MVSLAPFLGVTAQPRAVPPPAQSPTAGSGGLSTDAPW